MPRGSYACTMRVPSFTKSRWLAGELEDELKFHLAMLEDGFRARGMTASAAKSAACREFGGVAQIQEVIRERRGIA